jgi:hypothetical protein
MFFAMLAAQAIALPVLRTRSLEPRFSATMNAGGAASAKVRIVVSSEGVPLRCKSVFVNGPQSNADALCAMVLKDVRSVPRDQRRNHFPGAR